MGRAAHAATLDTPPLLDLTSASNFICNFANLDVKTAILNPSGTSGLIRDDGLIIATFPTAVSVPPGQTATTIRSGCSRGSDTLARAAACRCHFEFTGVSKAKVRAALSTDVAGSVAAE
jgi:hypothetical protein